MASHSHFNFSWKNVFDPKGLGLGLSGAVVNFGIEYKTDEYDLYKESLDKIKEGKKGDSSIDINSQIQ